MFSLILKFGTPSINGQDFYIEIFPRVMGVIKIQ